MGIFLNEGYEDIRQHGNFPNEGYDDKIFPNILPHKILLCNLFTGQFSKHGYSCKCSYLSPDLYIEIIFDYC